MDRGVPLADRRRPANRRLLGVFREGGTGFASGVCASHRLEQEDRADFRSHAVSSPVAVALRDCRHFARAWGAGTRHAY